jgi:hypothetical protein
MCLVTSHPLTGGGGCTRRFLGGGVTGRHSNACPCVGVLQRDLLSVLFLLFIGRFLALQLLLLFTEG